LRSAAEGTAVAAVFMAAVEVEVDSTGVAAGFMAAVARLAVAAGSVEDAAAATSAARDLLVEAPTEAARPWAAGALHLVDPVDLDAGSTLQVVDMQAATDTVLTMRSRMATGILSGVLEAPRLQEVQRDFVMPELRMADGTHLEARTRV
jgi:hypothetical protein